MLAEDLAALGSVNLLNLWLGNADDELVVSGSLAVLQSLLGLLVVGNRRVRPL